MEKIAQTNEIKTMVCIKCGIVFKYTGSRIRLPYPNHCGPCTGKMTKK